MSDRAGGRMKHQLIIHLDYSPDVLSPPSEIRYSYPLSGPHELKEQVVHVSAAEISNQVKESLDDLREALLGRIEAKSVRLPHAEITAHVRPTIMTVVIQDQRRDDIPCVRMYYLEEIEEIGSRVEKQVRMEPRDFNPFEREAGRGSVLLSKAWLGRTTRAESESGTSRTNHEV